MPLFSLDIACYRRILQLYNKAVKLFLAILSSYVLVYSFITPGLNGIAQRSARAMAFHRGDVGAVGTGVLQGAVDGTLLRWPVRGG